ncbi:Slm4p NDAI_0A07560 [Naumovozyma dairenensis CBS 421]|uniref:Uncharacterized protein n=1 Tax=Naumovozyma dairenensis (strain ATCC 10597 / BCRC 20456 / CBS 421 / NBRC 0211 / NRRL Y-12639) TaxID=1071378 RepID=G0W522_NAUDC|nr:hypothetical protein NDAI_0A07560 [Naumovozyma dairenensis CBS 421]CCD22910.1 hypothetical protein NDAI_0A07560 [Naumovozyma dairenensis CBS 421]
MIHADNIRQVLEATLKPIKIRTLPIETPCLKSSLLLSALNGAIMAYANADTDSGAIFKDDEDDTQDTDEETQNTTSQATTMNNLKMMSLLIKDKWSEDEKNPEAQTTNSCYIYDLKEKQNKDENITDQQEKVEQHQTTDGGSSLQKPTPLPTVEGNVNDKSSSIRIYTYAVEDLHACVTEIPRSDLLLLFIADNSYPYGLLVLKMKALVSAVTDLYGYKLG